MKEKLKREEQNEDELQIAGLQINFRLNESLFIFSVKISYSTMKGQSEMYKLNNHGEMLICECENHFTDFVIMSLYIVVLLSFFPIFQTNTRLSLTGTWGQKVK